jgi:uncharacterized protein involved in cysteine biosynthesis
MPPWGPRQTGPMTPRPCSVCAYLHAEPSCPHCGGASREPGAEGPRVRGPRGALTGALAPLMGARLLARGPRLKRVLVPPMVLVTALAVWLHAAWIAPGLEQLFASASGAGEDAGWWARSLAWLTDSWAGELLQGLSWALALIITAWLAFTLLFEVVAGPFLDEVQARLESRWFGADPRASSARPAVLEGPQAARLTLAGAAASSLAALVLAWLAPSPWLALLAPLPVFGALALRDPSYRAWLTWALGHELGLLWTSAKVALLSLLVLVLLAWLPFVPVIGAPLWVLISGFLLALGLCDVAFSRRGWSARARVRFVLDQAPAFGAFGLVGGLLVGVPVLGPALAVPCLSVGSLWLITRLDTGPGSASRG